ncbi:MAG: putative phage tail [Nocardia sp.]|uniref:phage tail tape measure protein n=1 Tax=Nocardia sp. TaxID=1821 RepID=UPI0026344DD8|nr:phage tail tape measure protein [Nocardia sp.]MCU1640917.1 putative phage tail [Nocardia sp.]
MAGGRIDILLHPDTRDFANRMRSGLSPALGMAAGIGASLGLAIGGGAAAAFGKVISIGNDFTTSLNTLKAVAGATADQMAAVSAKSKELGNDITLPGTSANDAAAAMTELAKGGFTVQQSMDAAKGSLQLAAAAQIDAAQAATIQSAALQAFGLSAGDATRVADVLANTANASSAEITDVAQGLQAAGAVAHQFGLSVEDTATALGMFANSGIKGSDAGTLLKSALLALTDQGKPAQEAIKELGLTVYDGQGKFAGLRNMFVQLQTASQHMTPEMYQAATATLFGSDAMRLAGIAAEKGVSGYDSMYAAMSRQGSAADVAAAKMQGLPGAMEMAQNAAEGLALEIYDLVKGPLEQFTKNVAGFITDETPRLVSGLHEGAGAIIGIGQAAAPVAKAFLGLPTPILAAVGALVLLRTTSIGTAVATAATATAGALRSTATAAIAVATATSGVARVAGVGAVGLGRFGSAVQTLGTHLPIVGRMQTSFLSAAAGASTLARTQGTLAAAATGLRGGLSSVVSFLGGPWVVGIALAAGALVKFYTDAKESERRVQAVRSAMRDLAVTKSDLTKIFDTNGGALDSTAVSNMTEQVRNLYDARKKAAEDRPTFSDTWLGTVQGKDGENENRKSIANQWQGATDAIDKLNISFETLGSAMTDDAQFAAIEARLRAMGKAGNLAADDLKSLRENIQRAQQTAAATTPGFATLTQAVKVLSDQSATAADRVDAMKTALDILSGKPVDAQAALAKYNQTVRETAAASAEVWDKTAGFGDQLIGKGGAVDTATANGDKLYQSLLKIKDATVTAAEAGVPLGQVFAQNDTQFADLAHAAGLTTDQIAQMAAQLGYLPHDIEILADLKGADSVEQKLVVIDGLLRNTGGTVEIPLDMKGDADLIAKLREAGAQVDEINGKPGVVNITAPDLQAVLDKLAGLINTNLPDKTQKVKVQFDESQLNLPARQPLNPGSGDNKTITGGNVGGRADGGIDGALPGQATIKSARPNLIQWAEPETAGEAFIPLASSKRERSTNILGTVAGMFGFQLTPMANGGIAVPHALSFLQGESGKPYQYAGVGNPSWDCSAFISAAYALLKGLDPYTRWFTTESNFASLGFLNGTDPTGKGLTIAVFNGGGGQYSHMVGDLAGNPLESGSNGVRVGAGATSVLDSQFQSRWYLPTSAFYDAGTNKNRTGGKNGKAQETWDASDELELRSANIAVTQAIEARDKEIADPNSKQSETDSAQVRVEQAQLRVKELETKRDQAQSSKDVPSAPELTGSMTSDQISLADLQDALDTAEADRDDVYNDATATDTDRAAADRAVYKARNAIVAEQKKQSEATSSSSTDSSSVVGLIGDVAKTAVTGQLSDLLTVIGLNGDIGGAVGASITEGKKYYDKTQSTAAETSAQQQFSKPSISQGDVDKQGPVTPGTPGWFEQLLKTFTVPTVLRDQGGPLPHGVAALNLSGQQEWVLTGDQVAQARSLAANQVSGGASSVDNSVTIQNLSTGMSAGEFQREWKMMQLDQQQRAKRLVSR